MKEKNERKERKEKRKDERQKQNVGRIEGMKPKERRFEGNETEK